MEIIRKQISLDKCLNHVNGYRPFVPFNPSNDYNSKIIENCDSYPNLNYKQFVCDIKTKDGVIVKYLDIMSAYNLVLDEVRKGIFIYYDGKVYHTINYRDNNIKISDNLIKINLKGCNIKCNEWVDIQDIKPLDIDNFIKIDEYTYKLNEEYFDDEIESDEEMDSENECKCVYYVLIKNFDKVKKLADFYLNLFGLSSKSDRFNDSGYYLNFIYFVKTKFIDSKNDDGTIKYDCVIPTVDIPVMLEEECTYDTMYQTYEYTYDGLPVDVNISGENFKGINGGSIIEFNDELDKSIITDEYILKQSYQDVDIKVESKLMQLIHPETIDINENLSGLLNEYSNELFEAVKEDGVWTTITKTILSSYTAEELSCVDNIGFSDNVVDGITEYMNIPFLSCLNTKEFENYPDGKYVFSVKYQNDENNKLKIPFKEEYIMNETTYSNGVITYDTIKDITYNTNDTVTIKYIIGAEFGKTDSGIMYQETLNYISGETEVYFDGYDNVKIYYENIDFNTNKMTIFNNEYGVYTDVKMSKIIKMPIQDIWGSGACYQSYYTDDNNVENAKDSWTKFSEENNNVKYENFENNVYPTVETEYSASDSGSPEYYRIQVSENDYVYYAKRKTPFTGVVAPLFTKENIESLYNIPKIDVGITFNRGNAAGWEKHFKLSECNTMKDLEQYGNNFFNL